jgi:hypothetical protein
MSGEDSRLAVSNGDHPTRSPPKECCCWPLYEAWFEKQRVYLSHSNGLFLYWRNKTPLSGDNQTIFQPELQDSILEFETICFLEGYIGDESRWIERLVGADG